MTLTKSIIVPVCLALVWSAPASSQEAKYDPTKVALEIISKMKVKPLDWPQWCGTPLRNNVPEGKNIPTEWSVSEKTNIKWSAALGSQTYGNPVVANGKVYVGTNNQSAYIKRYPPNVDLGCLLCFDEATGKFLWQHSSEKLPTGRVHDWPQQGICCSPYCDGDRCWFVSSRGEVLCLDVEGFHDGENDGPFKGEPNENKDEADVIWRLDMMKEMGISQHNMCSCSVTCNGNMLFGITGNGVDEGHLNLPAPEAPSFFALDRDTGKVLWTDNSPGTNVLHGQWSSPAYGELGGVPQVIMGGGDGWVYSFHGTEYANGKPKLLWKFDANPKESKYMLAGRADRNHIIGTPCIYNGFVFVAVGEDPEHGEGIGHLYCIDPTKRGDVSPQLAFNMKDPNTPIAHKRIQAVEKQLGDFSKDNPNSAAVWHFESFDANADGTVDYEESMHRTIGSTCIKDDLLYIVDFSGLFHCIDAKTGKPYWSYDMLAAAWGSPLIVEDKVYVGDEDGDIVILKHSKKQEVIAELNMESSVYSTPIVANNILYIANRTHLFAITAGDASDGK